MESQKNWQKRAMYVSAVLIKLELNLELFQNFKIPNYQIFHALSKVTEIMQIGCEPDQRSCFECVIFGDTYCKLLQVAATNHTLELHDIFAAHWHGVCTFQAIYTLVEITLPVLFLVSARR